MGISKIQYFGDRPFVVKREMPIEMFALKDNVVEMRAVKMYMDYIHCNHVLKSQDKFIFVETIDDAEIIEIIEK